MDFSIDAIQPLSILVKELGISSWNALIVYVQKLPYGRNKSRKDLSLVLKEQKGTCSSKHAFLKAIAIENKIDEIELVLGMYKMSANNTAIGNTLENTGLLYIPEAHCYLKIGEERVDITSENASFVKIKNALLFEKYIQPEIVTKEKVLLHQQYIKDWIQKEAVPKSFEEVWSIREKCIAYLSKQ